MSGAARSSAGSAVSAVVAAAARPAASPARLRENLTGEEQNAGNDTGQGS